MPHLDQVIVPPLLLMFVTVSFNLEGKVAGKLVQMAHKNMDKCTIPSFMPIDDVRIVSHLIVCYVMK